MQKLFLSLISAIVFLTIAESCGTSSKLYGHESKNRAFAGQLSDSTVMILKQYLTSAASSKLKDTIIIKYDYNNKTCWSLLDENDDDYIMGF